MGRWEGGYWTRELKGKQIIEMEVLYRWINIANMLGFYFLM